MKMTTVFNLLKAAIKIWRIDYMYRKTTNIVKTVGIGLAAGAAVAAIGSQVAKSNRKTSKNFKKTASRALQNVGSFVGDIEKMMR